MMSHMVRVEQFYKLFFKLVLQQYRLSQKINLTPFESLMLSPYLKTLLLLEIMISWPLPY